MLLSTVTHLPNAISRRHPDNNKVGNNILDDCRISYDFVSNSITMRELWTQIVVRVAPCFVTMNHRHFRKLFPTVAKNKDGEFVRTHAKNLHSRDTLDPLSLIECAFNNGPEYSTQFVGRFFSQSLQ